MKLAGNGGDIDHLTYVAKNVNFLENLFARHPYLDIKNDFNYFLNFRSKLEGFGKFHRSVSITSSIGFSSSFQI